MNAFFYNNVGLNALGVLGVLQGSHSLLNTLTAFAIVSIFTTLAIVSTLPTIASLFSPNTLPLLALVGVVYASSETTQLLQLSLLLLVVY